MKKSVQATVTVDLDRIRRIVASAMTTECDEGEADPAKIQFDIGDKDDGYGFPESGHVVLRSATLVVNGTPGDRGGLSVVTQTTIEMDQSEICRAIAEAVSTEMEAEVATGDVKLHLTPRYQGDQGFEGPCLDKAVVAIKSI